MMQENYNEILAVFAVVAVLTGILKLLSGSRAKRYKQYPVLLASVIYSAVAVIVCMAVRQDIQSLCEENEILASCPTAAANLFILAGACVVKAVARIACSRHEPGKAAQRYYSFSTKKNCWLLLPKWVNYGRIASAASYAAALLTAAVLSAMLVLGREEDVVLYIYPAALLLILSEYASFIGGQHDLDEALGSISGTAPDHVRIDMYYKLVDIFRKLFPAELISSHFGCEYMNRSGSYDLIKRLEASPEREDRLTADHFRRLLTKKELNTDYILTVNKMTKGQSVVFSNTFYRDNSDYIALPLINALLCDKKCLVVTGRNSNCGDVMSWVEEMIQENCKLHSLWAIGKLGDTPAAMDVGVISAKEIYDLSILDANRGFFSEVSFVILLEPSQILITGQVGLGIIFEEIERSGRKPVYCICDRKLDGLVDTLSHLLHTEIVEVAAMSVPRSIYSGLLWDADGDFSRQRLFEKQKQNLGGGIELAATAIQYQIPKVTWYSESRTPLKDIEWLAGQNYAAICKYMHQPIQQKIIGEKIEFKCDLWSSAPKDEQFIIVDDEFCNMFSTMNMYLSRTSKQLFINVLAENYLLRDYMLYNRELFSNTPNAVMSLVPAYAKTERNTVLELILKMTFRPVNEREIANELMLTGVEKEEVFPAFVRLTKHYTGADDSLFTVHEGADAFGGNDPLSYSFTVSDEAFTRCFSTTIKNAYYIIEDEVGNVEYINAKQYGHITQTILPGQFVTYDGKYYEVKYISPSSGVILRRASALYDGRRYYRQLRKYRFEKQENCHIVSAYTIMDIKVSVVQLDFSVETSGYLLMKSNDDLCSAKLVDLTEDPSCADLGRKYKNKNVLKVYIPDTTERSRYTFCVILSEMLRTIFPDAWQYLAVLTPLHEEVEGMMNYLLYSFEPDCEEDCIYIVEDSELDLGLLEAIEKNLCGIFELITDYLEWHVGKIRESAYADPSRKTLTLPHRELEELEKQKKRRSLLENLKKKIALIFGTKDGSGAAPENPAQGTESSGTQETGASALEEGADGSGEAAALITLPETGFEPPDSNAEEKEPEKNGGGEQETEGKENESKETEGKETESKETESKETESKGSGQGLEATLGEAGASSDTDIFVNSTDDFELQEFWDAQFSAAGLSARRESRYRESCYLKFGFEKIDQRLEIAEVIAMLRSRGYYDSAIKKARKRIAFDEELCKNGDAVNYCDFCGEPLSGISYDKLADGRVRCNNCAATAITSIEEFSELFTGITELMKGYYRIDYSAPIDVRTEPADKIAASEGLIFIPTAGGVSPRILGYAMQKGRQFSIVIENGSPRVASIDTIVHEMTHIWQYLHWDKAQITALYENPDIPDAVLMVYEGMAEWASVQFMYHIGEIYHASVMEAELAKRDDAYGRGFLYYSSKYPINRKQEISNNTPFNTFPPL